MATAGLSSLRVLDLFAGNNVLWSFFKTERYYGIEKVKGKGKNLNADNIRVIESLDLVGFNVIDCDSYGIPFKQIMALYENETLQNGTVVLFTAITNKMSALDKEALKMFRLEEMYKKCKVLFNAKALGLFYGMLWRKGVRRVTKYTASKTSFSKEYGYFVVDRK